MIGKAFQDATDVLAGESPREWNSLTMSASRSVLSNTGKSDDMCFCKGDFTRKLWEKMNILMRYKWTRPLGHIHHLGCLHRIRVLYMLDMLIGSEGLLFDRTTNRATFLFVPFTQNSFMLKTKALCCVTTTPS